MRDYSIKGTFKSLDNANTYFVKIGDGNSIINTIDKPNGTATEVYFSGEAPVTISSKTSDTFEHVYIRSASINLISNFDLRPYIVAEDYNDIPVQIRMNNEYGTVIFEGYVIPLQYNQDYAQTYNEFTVECTDKLGVLEYLYVYDILPIVNKWEYKTPRYFMEQILTNAGFTVGQQVYNISYDYTNNTKINPIIFIGNDTNTEQTQNQDDWMNCKDALNEIGKIYGCYFWQDGSNVKIENILLYNTNDPTEIVMDDYMSDNSNISVDKYYNEIKCTVDISTIDETFIDPFNDDNFVATTEKAERVLTELMYKNKDNKYDNIYKFKNYCDAAYRHSPQTPIRDWHERIDDDENFEVYDNYCQVMKNSLFTFSPSSANYLNDYAGGVANPDGTPITANARYVLKWLWNHPGRAAFLSFGKTNNLNEIRNKAMPKIGDMSTKLYIQVNGTRSDLIPYPTNITDSRNNTYYNSNVNDYLETQFNDNDPICQFNIPYAYNITPTDKSVTNYIVISGKILLNPIVPNTGPICYGAWHDTTAAHPSGLPYNTYIRRLNTVQNLKDWWDTRWNDISIRVNTCVNHDVKNKEGDDGYYFQMYGWDNIQNPDINTPKWPFNQNPNYDTNIALPYLAPKFQKFTYNRSFYDTETTQIDTISQISVLACELKIGDYYLVEDFSLLDAFDWNVPASRLSDLYSWKKYEDCPEKDGVVQTWFTLSIDPGLDDDILGKEYDIKNTVTIQTGIDAEGMAIPIPFDSNLIGDITFKILKPYHAVWDNKELSFKWVPSDYGYIYQPTSTKNAIMDYVENIQLSDLKFSLYSNSTKGNGDNDLVYYRKKAKDSPSSIRYLESNDFDCKFCTSLSLDDVPSGIDYKPNNSAIMHEVNNKLEPWYGMNDYTMDGAITPNTKLEAARVYEQYNIWQRPRNIIQTTIKLTDPEKGLIQDNYYFNYLKNLDETYQIYKITERDIDLKANTMTCLMKDMS